MKTFLYGNLCFLPKKYLCNLIMNCLLVLTFCGCSAPTATLDLINVGRKALKQASAEKAQMYEAQANMYQTQLMSLDSAFDADVKLISAGGIKTDDGKAVELTADWIISARKGYSAARGQIENQMLQAQRNNIIEQDNITAGQEALDMAEDLIVMQWNVAEQLKAQFKTLTERNTNNGE